MGAPFAILPPHRRAAIEGEVEALLERVTRLIARLDHADGDPDELNGDESDTTFGEDELHHWTQQKGNGPGCIISDSAEADDEDTGVDDQGEDDRECEAGAWPERIYQPIGMTNGVANVIEDDEPRYVPAMMDRREPANAA